ncbi:unnamed protein product [Orchesella dallaii]|uniref:Uncharacterized protein n=1 Tax=Orchesella dallaii TaxID=48710 RepID=A0ABP1QQD1_9HEXA
MLNYLSFKSCGICAVTELSKHQYAEFKIPTIFPGWRAHQAAYNHGTRAYHQVLSSLSDGSLYVRARVRWQLVG